MPIIPRAPVPGALANAPAPVLDRERRPTVNRGAVIARLERLGDAAAQPFLPKSLAEPWGALGRVGEAVVQAGGVAQAIAKERQDAIDLKERTLAEQAFEAKKSEFESWKMREGQLRPESWGEKFDEMFKGFQPLDEKSKMSREGRDFLALEMEKAKGGYRGQLQVRADQAQFALAGDMLITQAQTAYALGDEVTADAILATGEGKYFHDFQANEYRRQGKETARRYRDEQAFQNNFAIASTDPDAWIEQEAAPEGMSPIVFARLKDVARGAKRDQVRDSAERLDNLIAKGDIKTPEQLDDYDDPVLKKNPALLESLKESVTKRNDAAHQRWVQENGVFQSVLFRKRVEKYNPENDPDGAELMGLTMAIRSEVPQETQGIVLGQLMDRAAGRPTKDDGPDAFGRKVITSLFNEGKFGEWKNQVDDEAFGIMQDPRWMREVGISKDDIAAIEAESSRSKKVALFRQAWESADKSTEKKRKAMAKFDIDMRQKVDRLVNGSDETEAYRGALQVQAEIEERYSEWLSANPKASPEARSAKVLELLPVGTRAGVLRQFEQEKQRSAGSVTAPSGKDLGKVTSYGYVNDETPDSNSSAGIGAWVSPAEQKLIKAGQDTPNKLRANDLAVSPDVEKTLRSAGVRPGDRIVVRFADGSTQETRWMDRTAAVWKGKPVVGRWDFYRANAKGHHEKEAARVVGFERIGLDSEPSTGNSDTFAAVPNRPPFSE